MDTQKDDVCRQEVNGEPAGPPRPRRKTRWSEIDLEKEKARIAKNKAPLAKQNTILFISRLLANAAKAFLLEH